MSPFLRFLVAKKLDGRIISYNCFPYDLVKADERVLPEAGILRIISVITQHKIAIIRNCIWTEASLHFLWNKGIIKSSLRTVDVYLSVFDLNSLSRKSDANNPYLSLLLLYPNLPCFIESFSLLHNYQIYSNLTVQPQLSVCALPLSSCLLLTGA